MKNYYSTVDNIVTTFSNIEEKRQVLILPSIFDFMECNTKQAPIYKGCYFIGSPSNREENIISCKKNTTTQK